MVALALMEIHLQEAFAVAQRVILIDHSLDDGSRPRFKNHFPIRWNRAATKAVAKNRPNFNDAENHAFGQLRPIHNFFLLNHLRSVECPLPGPSESL
jgi:hypothetical protein